MNDDLNPYYRPPVGGPSAGIPSGTEQNYADGHKVGEVVYRFGAKPNNTTREGCIKDMPGWYLADGTQPALIIDNTNYGSPDLTKKFILGADGTTYLIGATGGSFNLAAHTHDFTHESAHAITQPVFAAPAAHGITQAVWGVTQQPTFLGPTAHSTHGGHTDHAWTLTEIVATGLGPGPSGAYCIVKAVGLGIHADTRTHDHNHDAHDHNHDAPAAAANVVIAETTPLSLSNNHAAPARTTDVALTNNAPHSGGAVGAVQGTPQQIPPYLAVWPLIKVY